MAKVRADPEPESKPTPTPMPTAGLNPAQMMAVAPQALKLLAEWEKFQKDVADAFRMVLQNQVRLAAKLEEHKAYHVDPDRA